ncbi:Ribokinase-like protein [Dipodascopsis tothii]|uniref:Ribokinase-like protein n=1 Tax=Dipodascopsis tothii TaxID=44089 RepID=UPI0034CE08FA
MSYPLLVLGNPLLDMMATTPTSVLDKYEIKANDAILAEPKHMGIYEEMVETYKASFLAGGAAQNSARGAQYFLPADSVVYCGCVGDDKFGKLLAEANGREGVRSEYLIDPTTPTGKCAVVVTGQNRSMVTDLSAANNYKLEHLKSPEVWKFVEGAKAYYVGGFHLTVCVPAILALGEHAAANDKIFSMNLSAPFLSQFFKDAMDSVSPYWDYLIGNESEALAFAESHGYETTDIAEIAKKIAVLPKANAARPRHVIITQGTDSTIVVKADATGVLSTEVFPIIPVAADKVEDTNGAGDSFAGGFLAGLVLGESLAAAVARGHWLASWTVQLPGPAYPYPKKEYVA